MTMQDLDFSGRRVVITGAASGIGQGLARAFADQRAELVLLDRDREALAATVAELASRTTVSGLPMDLADDASVAAGVAQLRQQWDRVDVLINNAGIEQPTALDDVSAESAAA